MQIFVFYLGFTGCVSLANIERCEIWLDSLSVFESFKLEKLRMFSLFNYFLIHSIFLFLFS